MVQQKKLLDIWNMKGKRREAIHLSFVWNSTICRNYWNSLHKLNAYEKILEDRIKQNSNASDELKQSSGVYIQPEVSIPSHQGNGKQLHWQLDAQEQTLLHHY